MLIQEQLTEQIIGAQLKFTANLALACSNQRIKSVCAASCISDFTCLFLRMDYSEGFYELHSPCLRVSVVKCHSK
jgi:hypothetical protein